MRLFGATSFAHGIHPPESKDWTSGSPIRQFPFAPSLVVPLSQHVGQPAIPIVAEGEEVTRGQCIAEPDGFLSVAMHAPASGIIRRIGWVPSISGKMVSGFFLEPFAASTQEVLEGDACDAEHAEPEEIIRAIQRAGVVGLGGAGFPTHAKLRIPQDKQVHTLVINGAECEPYLTTDHRVMLEHASDVVQGIWYLIGATGAERVVVAIEANKPDAAASIREAIPDGAPITVEVLRVKYPQGAEKILITSILGVEIPSGGLPLDVGALCFNVASTAEIGRLLPHGAGLQERVITVSGDAIQNKGNYRVPIGTPLRFLLETVGVAEDVATVFLGGPMMGQAVSSLDIPITKGVTGVIALTQSETSQMATRTQYPCIRCGYCVDACPIFLNPSQLGLLAEQKQHEKMAGEYHLMDCFECGCCTFVCPSHIPLVQHFRVAKAAVRKKRQQA
jgi:electron transport complex protein RnfC